MLPVSRRSIALAFSLTLVGACAPQVRDFSGSGAEGGGGAGASGSGTASSVGPGGSGGGTASSVGPGGSGGAGGGDGPGGSGGEGATSASSSASTGPCAPPEVACGGGCVDVQTSPDHCGECGHGCQGGACRAGLCEPVELAQGQWDVVSLAVGANAVFWTAKARGDIMSVPLDGGRPTTLATGQRNPENIAIDANGVYWSTILVPDAAIKALPRGAAAEQVLYEGSERLNGLVVHRETLYFVDASGRVASMYAGGGRITTYASDRTNPRGVAADDNHVYWTSYYGDDAGVRKHDFATRTTTVLASGQAFPFAIEVGARQVYWSNLDNGTLMTVPIEGGTPTPVAIGQGRITDIALDESGIYWVDSMNGTVMALPRGSSTPVTLATGQKSPFCIAVDATSVYWGTNDAANGVVMKVAK
ncbi:hypothetical protein [Sorangium sp. So ce1335]|uniref:hypothetical protein n=1 Tax=Sorangium sp. So ce1335 TaxID=3133335 RepID=UPI003F5ECB55